MEINMTSLRMLLSSLIFVAAAAGTENLINGEFYGPVSNCYSDYIVPVKHDIELILLVEKSNNNTPYCHAPFHSYIEAQQINGDLAFYGKSTVVINITRTVRYIKLRIRQPLINILTIRLISKYEESHKNHKYFIHEPQRYSYDYDAQTFILYFRNEIEKGLYTLKTDFVGAINDIVGLFATTYVNPGKDEKWLVAISDFQTITSKLIFPCLDRPELEANFNISIKQNGYNILSNMDLKEMNNTIQNGMASWQCRITSETKNYLVFIILDDFVPVSNHREKIIMWCRQHLHWHMTFMWRSLENIPQYLENEWHIKSLNPQILHLIIPGFQENGIKMTRGLIFYRESNVMYNIMRDHDTTKMQIVQLVTRKFIHQCLGDTSSWLMEGFITLLEAYSIDKMFDEFRMLNLFVVQKQHESLHLDYYFNGKPIEDKRDSNSLSYFPYHNKASFILRMLQHLITDEVFREGIQKYLNKHASDSTAVSNDLWAAMQDALREKSKLLESEFRYEQNINLTSLMIGWMKQKHYPIVRITRDYDKNWITMQLESYIPSDMQDVWMIPVTFTSQTHPNFDRTSLNNVHWLKCTSLGWPTAGFPLNFEEDGWIIANLQQAGYYRINYDSVNWNKIANYLNSPEYTKIHVLNRAQIIDDSFHLAVQEKQNFSLFWKITSYLSQETDYVAWYPMFKALEYISNIFSFKNRRVEHIRIFLNEIFDNLFATIRDETSTDTEFIEYLSQEAAKWACTLNNNECLQQANYKLRQHLERPKMERFFPWWKEWIFCQGLKLANYDTFTTASSTLSHKDLKLLACVQDFNIIKQFFKSLKLDIKIEEIEKVHIFHSIIAKHAKDNETLDFIFSNFDEIKPRQISTIIALIDIINHVYSKEQLIKIMDFVKIVKDEPSLINIRNKIKLRTSQIEIQTDYLKHLQLADDIIYNNNNNNNKN